MGLTKKMMLDFQEAEANELEELKGADLDARLESINDEITIYYEEIIEELENLLSNDIEDEFEKDRLIASAKEISTFANTKNDILEKIARYNVLKNSMK